MEKRSIICGVLILLLACTVSFGSLTEIVYGATDLGGGKWRYDYQVKNIGLDSIKKFAIRFDYDLYSNMEIIGAGASGWQKVIFQPDEEFEVDGEFNGKGKSPGIATGETLSGFSVSFDWSGTGTPGSQYYAIINPSSFEIVEIGTTKILSDIPEPATIILIGAGGFFCNKEMAKEEISNRI